MNIDSNIVIAYLAGEESVAKQLSIWKEEGRPLFLSTIAEAEVLGFPDFTSEEREHTARFMVEQFVSMACDRAIAYHAGVLRGTINIKLPDALIAATTLLLGINYFTGQTRLLHLPLIPKVSNTESWTLSRAP